MIRVMIMMTMRVVVLVMLGMIMFVAMIEVALWTAMQSG